LNGERNHLTRGAILIAAGLILPLIFHAFNMGGQVFLPMHIPVLLGGLVLSPAYAAAVGLITPLLSSIFMGMPQMPFTFPMMAELLTYGLSISLIYRKYVKNTYAAMIIGMIAGRVVSIIANYILFVFVMGSPFSFAAFAKTLTVAALPGIAIQLVFVPVLASLILRYDSAKSKPGVEAK